MSLYVPFSLTTRVLEDGRIIPNITTYNASCLIDRNNFKLNLYANVYDIVVRMAEEWVGWKIAGVVEDTLRDIVRDRLAKYSNAFIASYDGRLPRNIISNSNIRIDWQTPEPVYLSDNFVGLGIKGLFYDLTSGPEEPAV